MEEEQKKREFYQIKSGKRITGRGGTREKKRYEEEKER